MVALCSSRRELLRGTTVDEESMVVRQERVGECYERRLEFAEGSEQALSLRFCRVERNAVGGE